MWVAITDDVFSTIKKKHPYVLEEWIGVGSFPFLVKKEIQQNVFKIKNSLHISFTTHRCW